MATQVIGRVAFVPKGNWSQATSYSKLDVVLYSVANGGDGCSYVAKKANSSVTPGTDATTWMKITERGEKEMVDGGIFIGPVVEDNVTIVTEDEPL